MAHNLNFQAGKASFFSVREKPWHGLGQIVQDRPTSEEAIKLAGLDYQVVKEPVFHKAPDGSFVEVENSFVTKRADTNDAFGIVGSRYEVLQNVDAFKFFDEIVGGKEAIYETAGALGKGETIFITAKLPDYIRVGKDDLIEQYIFLTNNHNGKGVVQAAFTPIRIVCNNTLNAALKQNANRVRIMHNGDVVQKVKEAHKLMGIINQLSKDMSDVFNIMAKKPIVDEELKSIIVKTFATPEQLNKLAKGEEPGKRFEDLISDCFKYAMVSDTQQMETTKGTVFGAYNAITGYLQNVKEFKSKESQLVSVLDGPGLDYNQKAFNLCRALI